MQVHQVIAAAAPGDAVTGQALAWRAALRDWGVDGTVVAEHVHPTLEGRVRRLDARGERLRGDALVVHYSVWSRAVEAALTSDRPVALCYHNVTPGGLLRAYNPALADECDRARASLARLTGRVGPLIADSAYNAGELAAAGVGEAAVVPLLLDLPTAVPAARPAPGTRPSVLSVGRIVPNKRLDDVLRAFALFRDRHAPDATLTVVGSDDGFEPYSRALQDLAARIGDGGVRFTGRVDDTARDAAYARADAYLCMSEHEGFCAPLVEALAHGIPVVARAAAAVPETLGGAGVLVDHPDMLPLAAEALAEVMRDGPTRTGLVAAGARRLDRLRAEAVLPLLRTALAPLLWPT